MIQAYKEEPGNKKKQFFWKVIYFENLYLDYMTTVVPFEM